MKKISFLLTIAFLIPLSSLANSLKADEASVALAKSLSPVLRIGSPSLMQKLDELPLDNMKIDAVKKCVVDNRDKSYELFAPIFTKYLSVDEMVKVANAFNSDIGKKYLKSWASKQEVITELEQKDFDAILGEKLIVRLDQATQEGAEIAQSVGVQLAKTCFDSAIYSK